MHNVKLEEVKSEKPVKFEDLFEPSHVMLETAPSNHPSSVSKRL
jgi:hypothetical protein